MDFGIFTKVSGSWVRVLRISERNSSWTKMRNVYVKVSGYWKRVHSELDKGILSLFLSTPTLLPNEKGEKENAYNGRLVRLSTSSTLNSTLYIGGSDSHSYHGNSNVVTLSTVYHTFNGDKIDVGNYRVTTSDHHNHTLPAHSHNGNSTNHTPKSRNFSVYRDLSIVYKGFIVLATYTLDSSYWDEVNIDGRFIRLDNSNPFADYGYYSHNHGYTTVYTSQYYSGQQYHSAKDNNWNPHHKHKLYHKHNMPNLPYNYGFKIFKAKKDGVIIPAGAMVFLHHSTSYYPVGFTSAGYYNHYVRHYVNDTKHFDHAGSFDKLSYDTAKHYTFDKFNSERTWSGSTGNIADSTSKYRNWSHEYYTLTAYHSHSTDSYSHKHSTYKRNSDPKYVRLHLVKKTDNY